jgi:hypothetical protein
MSSNSDRRPYLIWIYFLFGVCVLALLVWTSLRALQETPAREASVQLPDQGWVTFRLSTEPYPPLPTGIVTLKLEIINNRSATIDIGPSVPFTYGVRGNDAPKDGGKVEWNGSTYQKEVKFPTSGNYWLTFDLGDDKQIDFQIYVKPAQ